MLIRRPLPMTPQSSRFDFVPVGRLLSRDSVRQAMTNADVEYAAGGGPHGHARPWSGVNRRGVPTRAPSPQVRARRLLRDVYAQASNPKSGKHFAFDILVVDEAHHVAPASPPGITGGRGYAVDTQHGATTRRQVRAPPLLVGDAPQRHPESHCQGPRVPRSGPYARALSCSRANECRRAGTGCDDRLYRYVRPRSRVLGRDVVHRVDRLERCT
jgi:hypothetical protein